MTLVVSCLRQDQPRSAHSGCPRRRVPRPEDHLPVARPRRCRDGEAAPGAVRTGVRRPASADRSAQSGVEGGLAALAVGGPRPRRAAGPVHHAQEAHPGRSRVGRRQHRRRGDPAGAEPSLEARARRHVPRAPRRPSGRGRAVLPRRGHGARPWPGRRHLPAGGPAEGPCRAHSSGIRGLDGGSLWLVRRRTEAAGRPEAPADAAPRGAGAPGRGGPPAARGLAGLGLLAAERSRGPGGAPPSDDWPDPPGPARCGRRHGGHVGVGLRRLRAVRAGGRGPADGTGPEPPGLDGRRHPHPDPAGVPATRALPARGRAKPVASTREPRIR